MDAWTKLFYNRSFRRVLVFLLIAVILYLLRSMIDIILLTFIFSFLINRLENFILKRISIYRKIIVIILYAFIALGITLLIVKYIPMLIEQMDQLIRSINHFYTKPSNNETVNYIMSLAKEFEITKYANDGIQFLFTYLANIGVVAMNTFIALILSLFFSLGKEQLILFTSKFGQSKVAFIYDEVKYFGGKFNETFGKVIEAQFMIALVNCVLTTIALWIMGFPQLFSLAIMVFLLGLIPVAGVIISMVPLTIIAYTIGGVNYVLIILVLVVVIHALESYVLNPKLMSAKTDLPVFYTFIVLIFSEHFFGIWGLIVGIPVFMFFLDVLGVINKDEVLVHPDHKITDK
ncbi:AI-2E family transporter [Listeria newyorkensis]|uniref:AI-2E family transporter n=1 Tax=Listeria newyorkensis TaxID=1497681 RepID=A0A841YSU7_9LIST|nr:MULTISPECIES: AI-2E family transporter [Listeria]KGL45268.1 membrane protein [Listeriaceae bacterium FSL A5-0209]KGL40162.1 membrane protein [Listeria newyorkensis]MBC1456470.1 AI-2E family transporter [Listeria newyorkensis]PNP93441.1 AI-2E family transporter [Listeria newyorkensis]RQW68099.1 AI-2E family transporter [Listeria sp. SHR_NRA_18]